MVRRQVIKDKSFYSLLHNPLFLANFLGIYPAYKSSINIIFDLGGVLLNIDSFALYRQMGIFKLLLYIFMTGKNPRTLLVRVLNDIDLPDLPDKGISDEQGNSMSKGMIHWFCGTSSCQQIKDSVLRLLDSNPSYCSSYFSKKLVWSMVSILFDSQSFAKCIKLNEDAITFINECVKNKNRLYILSNWDSESFILLKNKYRDFFDLFDGIIVSGDVQMAKPDPLIFYHILKKYNLNILDTVFVDDQRENINASEAIGIHSILCPKTGRWYQCQDFDKVRLELNLWQIERILEAEKEETALSL